LNYKKALLLTGMALMFTACGGGGGTSDVPPEPLIEYDLRTFIDKSSLTLNLEGIVDGTTVQGTYYVTYEGTFDYMGTTLDLHQQVAVIDGTTDTSYMGTYLGNLYAMLLNDGTECYIAEGVTPTPIPTNATIGYVSDVVPLECTEGSRVEISVKLLAGEGDSAIAATTAKWYNAYGSLLLTSESYTTFDPNMNILAYEIKTGNIIFQATSITQN